MALTTNDTIKLYLTINKLMYKHAETTKVFYTKNRNPDVDSKEFLEILEMSLIVDMLIEEEDPLVKDGTPYPNYLNLEGTSLNKFLDYVISRYKLDPVPYLDFPKNNVNYINTANVVNVGGTPLPNGGGVDYYLTKDINDNLTWKQFTFVSSFNNI
jgi:hypothetical protein